MTGISRDYPGKRGHHGNETARSDRRNPDRGTPGRARAVGARPPHGLNRARDPGPRRGLVRVLPHLIGVETRAIELSLAPRPGGTKPPSHPVTAISILPDCFAEAVIGRAFAARLLATPIPSALFCWL